MKIKYEIEEISGICKTSCPYDMREGFANAIVQVGSAICQRCKHHFKIDEPDTILCTGGKGENTTKI